VLANRFIPSTSCAAYVCEAPCSEHVSGRQVTLNLTTRIQRARRRARSLRSMAVILALLASLTLADAVPAAPVADLYEVVVRPTERTREAAFADALRQIAVRVSGNREAAERLDALKPNAARYVTRFSYQPDGSAAVGFDATVFDRMLTESGLPVWGSERPAIAVWLAVEDVSGRLQWRGSSEMAAERTIVERVAKARGLPLVWPFVDAADISAASSAASVPTYQGLMQLGVRYRADAVLLGVVRRDTSVRWLFAFNDAVLERTTSLEEGVHMAADRCAQLLAIAPGALAEVPIQISGIRDLDAYARVLTYLEGLTVVANGGVIVDELHGEQLELRLKVRGDAATLQRTLALGRRLIESSAEPANGRLVYRLAQ